MYQQAQHRHSRILQDIAVYAPFAPMQMLNRQLKNSSGIESTHPTLQVYVEPEIVRRIPDLFLRTDEPPSQTAYPVSLDDVPCGAGLKGGEYLVSAFTAHAKCMHNGNEPTMGSAGTILADISPQPDSETSIALLAHQYSEIQDILEVLGDISGLAEVVQLSLRVCDFDLLQNILETVIYHRQSFRAMGLDSSIQGIAIARYQRLRAHEGPNRSLAQYFVTLGQLPNATSLIVEAIPYFTREKAQAEQVVGIAATTPASESLAADDDVAKPNIPDEVQQALAQGNSLDGQAMERIFQAIRVFLCKARVNECAESIRGCMPLFARLQDIDNSQYHLLAYECYRAICQIQDVNAQIFAILCIEHGCLELSFLLKKTLEQCTDRTAQEGPDTALSILELLANGSTGIDRKSSSADDSSLRVRTPISVVQEQEFRSILDLAFLVIIMLRDDDRASSARLRALCDSSFVFKVLIGSILHDAQNLNMQIRSWLAKAVSPPSRAYLRRLLLRLMDPQCQHGRATASFLPFTRLTDTAGLRDKSFEEIVYYAFSNVDQCSLPFYGIGLANIASLCLPDSASKVKARRVVMACVGRAISHNLSYWNELLAFLPGEVNVLEDVCVSGYRTCKSLLTSTRFASRQNKGYFSTIPTVRWRLVC